MATVAKNFRVKNGLVVEGTTATVNGNNILTTANSTSDLVEGSNLYFTDERVQDAVNSLISAGSHGNITIAYDDEANSLSFTVDQALIPDTDALSEGSTNLYYTDERVQDAVNALIGAGTHQNIQITYDDVNNTLSFVAENGVADSTTSDLAEGTNLYFTNQRALDATNAAYDAAGSAATAESNAKTYTDGRETAITTAYEAYADQAEADAISTASADATSKANTAESNANDRTDLLIGDGTVNGTAGNTVKDRIDAAVANLIGGAPELLDTLDELAAAIADDENFSTTVVSDIAQGLTDAKAYTDTRETAITTAYQSYADTAEADAISTAAADATSKANAAQSAAEATASADATSKANAAQAAAEATASADATSKANAAQAAAEATAAADATSKANTAESNANTYTDNAITAADTDDIQEGSGNLYFTDERAQDAVAAAIAAGTHENIVITYDDNAGSISFVAENGVAGSTTDNLTEGSSNLYFTDQRAVDALQAVTPVFTEVDINSVALNVASTVSVTTQNTTGVVYSFDSGSYTSAKFIVKADTGTHTEVTEVLVTLDSSSNIAITEYAIVNTGGSLIDVTAVMNGTDVELQATVVNDNTTVSATGTLIV
jgi:hypothetical protein